MTLVAVEVVGAAGEVLSGGTAGLGVGVGDGDIGLLDSTWSRSSLNSVIYF